jgi:hypothetical protein
MVRRNGSATGFIENEKPTGELTAFRLAVVVKRVAANLSAVL